MVCCLQYREESDSFLVCFLNWVVVKIMYNYIHSKLALQIREEKNSFFQGPNVKLKARE